MKPKSRKCSIMAKFVLLLLVILFFLSIRFLIKYFGKFFQNIDPKCLKARREEIKEVMQMAWSTYHEYAWGYDFLNPQSHKGEDLHGVGYTILDSLDSLLLMGLRDEYEDAIKWINESLTFNTQVSFFETVIRCVGGLLSAYERTHDKILLDTAKKLGDKLLPAFDTPTGLPRVLIDLETGIAYDHKWARGSTLLADAGTCQIEFLALTIYTGKKKYFDAAIKALLLLKMLGPIPPTHIRYTNVYPYLFSYSFDAFGDSYFEYLIKLHLYSPDNSTQTNIEFHKAIEEAFNTIGFTHWATKLPYFATVKSGEVLHSLSHLAFFLPGTLFLAAKEDPVHHDNYLYLAESLLTTGIKLYIMHPTKLGGETAKFDTKRVSWIDDTFKLRPELVESLFYSWRTTHKITSRYWAWEIFKAIKRYCSTDGAFTTVHDTSTHTVIYDDLQDSFFLSETLKYLYLIFSDDSVYSLDDYVFTTQAHPLKRIKPYKK